MTPLPQGTGRDWLEFLLSTASDNAIIVLDEAGTIVEWLGGAERRFGYTQEEAIGLDFGVLFTSEDRHQGLDRQEMAVAAASNRSEDDRWHVRKNGSRFWGSGLLEAVRDEDGRASSYCKVLRDRTDVRTQVDALQNRLTFQEDEHWRRVELFVTLGHELRNALAPLQNATTLIASTEDPGTKSRSLSMLQRQLSAMTQLLDDHAQVSAAAVVQPRLKLESVVVQDALEFAASSVRVVVTSKSQELVVTVPSAPFAIIADPARLQQMLLNLLINACKYTPIGGHIHLTTTIEADEAIIRVTDDGMGISHEVLPDIFNLFTRGNPTQEAPGLGVGLAMVKELAASHGGGIEARSPGEGKGSVFSLRLPLEGPRAVKGRLP